MRKFYELDKEDIISLTAERFGVGRENVKIEQDPLRVLVSVPADITVEAGNAGKETAPAPGSIGGAAQRALEHLASPGQARKTGSHAKPDTGIKLGTLGAGKGVHPGESAEIDGGHIIIHDAAADPVTVPAEVKNKADAEATDAEAKAYAEITDDFLASWLRSGKGITELCRERGLGQHSRWRLYDRVKKMQKEDASIPKRGRRTKAEAR